jgi:hypothetical protein
MATREVAFYTEAGTGLLYIESLKRMMLVI